MRKINILLISILLIIATATKAQINLRPGYIITNLNDTVRGMIDFRTNEHNALACHFRANSLNEMKNYAPGDIYAYRFTDDGKFYVTRTVTINNSKQTLFLEYLIKGMISLYYYSENLGQHYFFENEEGRMVEVENKTKEVYVNGVRGMKKNNQYIGMMTWLFNKSDKVKKQIKNISLNRESLSRITKEYHYETCQVGEQCIEFETKKDKHFCKIKYEIRAGINIHTFSFSLEETDIVCNINHLKSLSPSLTAGVNLSIPRFSNMFSVKAEAEVGRYKGEKDNFATNNYYHKISIEAFTTDLRIGVNLQLPQAPLCPSIEGGLCETFLWKREASYSNTHLFYPSKRFRTKQQDISETIDGNYTGFYGGIGFLIPLKKGAFSIKAFYATRKHDTDKLKTWSGSIGYIF